jgi:xanthine dehydrogenase accessory factor
MMAEVLRLALAALDRGESFALVSVVDATGSTPGKPGHKMIVYPDGRQEGTVGGGALEQRAIEAALDCLRRGRGGVLTLSLSPEDPDSIGAVCGGEATLAIEVMRPAARILICGGGHVAMALARQCDQLGFAYTVVDQRGEMVSSERYPSAVERAVLPPPSYIEEHGLSFYTHVIILTHSHEVDRDTLRSVARAGFGGYTGMIGSRRKWAEVRADLERDGLSPEWLDRVHCPIGLSIGAQSPAEIAVAIAAELIQDIHLAEGNR